MTFTEIMLYDIPPAPAPETESLEMYTAEEVAKLAKVDVSTVYRLMKGGALRAVKFGRSTRVTRADLEAFINSHRATG